jgi:hypothetical protein
MKYACLAITFLLFVCVACNFPQRQVSFYYWKTIFQPGTLEKEALSYNGSRTLYIRYCDVDVKPGDTMAKPVSPVVLDTFARSMRIVPVVFIKNRTFSNMDSSDVEKLAQRIFRYISGINNSMQLSTGEIQFDCDWSEGTRDRYFYFLSYYRSVSRLHISATIRLHQVKYPKRSGIPPVDHAVLMYYNMGKIDGGQLNSIYEKATAGRYNSYISDYPLQMDVALPIFSWGLKIRNGQVEELLNKIYFSHFQNDSNFNAISSNRFVTKNACFKAGYYFAKHDVVKIENIPTDKLLEMAEQLSHHSKKIKDIIFYDLDSSNLVQYEKDIFKKVLARIR